MAHISIKYKVMSFYQLGRLLYLFQVIAFTQLVILSCGHFGIFFSGPPIKNWHLRGHGHGFHPFYSFLIRQLALEQQPKRRDQNDQKNHPR